MIVAAIESARGERLTDEDRIAIVTMVEDLRRDREVLARLQPPMCPDADGGLDRALIAAQREQIATLTARIAIADGRLRERVRRLARRTVDAGTNLDGGAAG